MIADQQAVLILATNDFVITFECNYTFIDKITMLNIQDTVSYLETSVAESEAYLTSSGQFCHTLRNKDSFPITVSHDTVYISHDSIRTEYLPYPVSVPSDKPLTIWQQFRIRLGDTAGFSVLLIIFLNLIRKNFFKR